MLLSDEFEFSHAVFLCFALISSMKSGGRLLPIAISVGENQVPSPSTDCNVILFIRHDKFLENGP